MHFFISVIFYFLTTVQAEDVVVTAERIDRSYSDSTSTITHVSSEEIDRSGSSDVADLLRAKAGIQVNSNGGAGKSTSLFLRGTDSRHTLVLIDDVEVVDTTSIANTPRLEFISLDSVESVEVLKGSQSVLYGSQAIGGVLKINSKKLSGKKETFIKAGYGSFNDKRLSFLTLGGDKDKVIPNYLQRILYPMRMSSPTSPHVMMVVVPLHFCFLATTIDFLPSIHHRQYRLQNQRHHHQLYFPILLLMIAVVDDDVLDVFSLYFVSKPFLLYRQMQSCLFLLLLPVG